MSSKATTANEQVDAVDPGGTHSTKKGAKQAKGRQATEEKSDQHVKSGDRNTMAGSEPSSSAPSTTK